MARASLFLAISFSADSLPSTPETDTIFCRGSRSPAPRADLLGRDCCLPNAEATEDSRGGCDWGFATPTADEEDDCLRLAILSGFVRGASPSVLPGTPLAGSVFSSQVSESPERPVFALIVGLKWLGALYRLPFCSLGRKSDRPLERCWLCGWLVGAESFSP